MPEPRKQRQVRVFISSTFRDMQAERDHPVTAVPWQLSERVCLCRADADAGGIGNQHRSFRKLTVQVRDEPVTARARSVPPSAAQLGAAACGGARALLRSSGSNR
jgi:hypothetical protein